MSHKPHDNVKRREEHIARRFDPEYVDSQRLIRQRGDRRAKFNRKLYPAWLCPRALLYSHWLDRVVSVRCHTESMEVEEWTTLDSAPREYKVKERESDMPEYPLHLPGECDPRGIDFLWRD